MKKFKKLIDLLPPKVQQGLEKEFNSDDFEYLEQLGQGSFANVCKVRFKQTNQIYALKAIKKQTIIQSRKIEQVLLELKIMYQLNHDNILKLHTHFEDDDHVNLILDYLPGGSLYDKLLLCGNLREIDAVLHMRQIVSAIRYLHDQPQVILHRDIKPENILMDEQGNIKLADFGSSNSLTQDNKVRYTYAGSKIYMAPEIIEKLGYDQTVDTWSLGVLIYELLAGDTPFLPLVERNTLGERDQDIKLEENIRMVKIIFPDHFSPLARDLVRKMLKREPTQRITLKEVLEHPWIKQSVKQLDGYNNVKKDEIQTRKSKIQESLKKFKDLSQNQEQRNKKQQFEEFKKNILDLKSQINDYQIKIYGTQMENDELKKRLTQIDRANEDEDGDDSYKQNLDETSINKKISPRHVHKVENEFNQLNQKLQRMQQEIIIKETQIAQNQIQIDELSKLEQKVKSEENNVEKLELQLCELDDKKQQEYAKLEQVQQFDVFFRSINILLN